MQHTTFYFAHLLFLQNLVYAWLVFKLGSYNSFDYHTILRKKLMWCLFRNETNIFISFLFFNTSQFFLRLTFLLNVSVATFAKPFFLFFTSSSYGIFSANLAKYRSNFIFRIRFITKTGKFPIFYKLFRKRHICNECFTVLFYEHVVRKMFSEEKYQKSCK